MEQYTVTIERITDSDLTDQDPDGDFIRETWYNTDGQIHRNNGPAVTETFAETGDIYSQHWCVNGVRHRENAPARETYFEGKSRAESIIEYYQNGVLHREDGPALLSRDLEGMVRVEEWKVKGEYHRASGGPAYRLRDYETGVTLEEFYYVNGEMHRDGDKPAFIERHHGSGVVVQESFYKHGVLHREGGKPASLYRSGKTGALVREIYAEKGKEYREEIINSNSERTITDRFSENSSAKLDPPTGPE